MKLVGIKVKESVFEGKTYTKYECHCLDSRRYPNTEGSITHVYDVRPSILGEVALEVGKDFDFVVDDGKVTAVFEIE